MAKEQNLNIRIGEEEMAALKRAAEQDERPASALARRILLAWLRENGWLEEQRHTTTAVAVERRQTKKAPSA